MPSVAYAAEVALGVALADPDGPLLVAYDYDAADTAATVRAADLLTGLDARVVQLPQDGTRPLSWSPPDRGACAAPWPARPPWSTRRSPPGWTGGRSCGESCGAGRRRTGRRGPGHGSTAGERARLVGLIAGRFELLTGMVTSAVLDG